MTIKIDKNILKKLEGDDLIKSRDREMLKLLTEHLKSAASLNEILTKISQGSKESAEMLSTVLEAHVKNIQTVTEALLQIKSENRENAEIMAPRASKVKVSRDKNGLIDHMIIIPLDKEPEERTAADKMFGENE